MFCAFAVLPSALVAIAIGIINDSIAVLFIIEPLSLVFASWLVMVDAFAVFFAVEKVALVFILIGVDDFALVWSLVIDPLSVIHGSA